MHESPQIFGLQLISAHNNVHGKERQTKNDRISAKLVGMALDSGLLGARHRRDISQDTCVHILDVAHTSDRSRLQVRIAGSRLALIQQLVCLGVEDIAVPGWIRCSPVAQVEI